MPRKTQLWIGRIATESPERLAFLLVIEEEDISFLSLYERDYVDIFRH